MLRDPSVVTPAAKTHARQSKDSPEAKILARQLAAFRLFFVSTGRLLSGIVLSACRKDKPFGLVSSDGTVWARTQVNAWERNGWLLRNGKKGKAKFLDGKVHTGGLFEVTDEGYWVLFGDDDDDLADVAGA